MTRWQQCLATVRRVTDQHRTKVKFLLAGVLNTLFGLGTYFAIYSLLAPLKFHYMVILVVSHLVCMTFAFLTNKFLVFRTSGNYLQEYAKFATFQIPYFVVNLLALPILVELARMNPMAGQMLFAVVANIGSYFWHSRISFSSSKTNN